MVKEVYCRYEGENSQRHLEGFGLSMASRLKLNHTMREVGWRRGASERGREGGGKQNKKGSHGPSGQE